MTLAASCRLYWLDAEFVSPQTRLTTQEVLHELSNRGRCFSARDVYNMELIILSTLDWRLHLSKANKTGTSLRCGEMP